MSDPNTPPPMDDSEAGDTPSTTPDESVAESTPTSGGVSLGQGTLSEPDEKMMGLLAHLLGGVTSIIGPLIIWLIKKDESPFVNDQGKEALNFQITVLIGYVAAGIVAFFPVIGCVSAILYPAIGVVSLVFAILGGIEANKGVVYRYPFAARFVN